MNVTVIGRGSVGGGLADRWERAGHSVTSLGRAREVTDRLIADAGWDPVYVGGLELARALEDSTRIFSAIRHAGLGMYFHRYAAPGAL